MPNLSKSLEPRPKYGNFSIFPRWRRSGPPPSSICNACVGTTHEGHLLVFITVQNLVGIDAVVLIMCSLFHKFGLKTPIYVPKLGVLTP